MKNFIKLIICIAIGYYLLLLLKYVFFVLVKNKTLDEVDRAYEEQGLWFSI